MFHLLAFNWINIIIIVFQNSRYQREAQGKGLQSRHAYTITKVCTSFSTARKVVCNTEQKVIHCAAL